MSVLLRYPVFAECADDTALDPWTADMFIALAYGMPPLGVVDDEMRCTLVVRRCTNTGAGERAQRLVGAAAELAADPDVAWYNANQPVPLRMHAGLGTVFWPVAQPAAVHRRVFPALLAWSNGTPPVYGPWRALRNQLLVTRAATGGEAESAASPPTTAATAAPHRQQRVTRALDRAARAFHTGASPPPSFDEMAAFCARTYQCLLTEPPTVTTSGHARCRTPAVSSV